MNLINGILKKIVGLISICVQKFMSTPPIHFS